LQRLERDDRGWLLSDDIPASLPADEPLVLRYVGPNFFADVPTVVDHLPAAEAAHPGVIVLNVGALQHYSSTMLKQLAKYHESLAAAGSGLVLVGIRPEQRSVLKRTGLLDKLGDDNVLASDPHLAVADEQGLQRGRELLKELSAARADHNPQA
jgi:SulP family sulfate permease